MIRNVLIVQPYGIGDMLFITPVLRALRLIPSVQRVDLLVGSRTQEVIAANPHVDRIHVIDKDKIHAGTRSENAAFLKNLAAELKKHRYDLLLDYSMRGEYAFWGRFMLGIPKRAGYAYKNRAFFHNIRIPIPEGFRNKHAVDYACDLAEKAGVPVKDRFVEFFFPAGRPRHFPGVPENYFTLSLGGGESWGKDAHLKRWPVERFAGLARRLIQKTGAEKAVLVGSAGEKELAAEFLKTGVPAEDWTGGLSLTQTAQVIKQSRFFLGNDGGLLHLARAVFKPAVGIYGPADPAVYGPYPAGKKSAAVYKPPADGRPRYYKFRYDAQDKSILDISEEDAWQMIEKSGVLSCCS